MSNQNSEKENLSPIYFSSTGDDLPPIEIEDGVDHLKHYTSYIDILNLQNSN